ncbi:hypothetical protein AB0I35_02405 [Nocardia sp. NPDC050378]|uniref:hypothetical protein n=1 Tax=Nocardia sp. NPDC050378 TaxID=3155400 RepID=UPI0033F929F7
MSHVSMSAILLDSVAVEYHPASVDDTFDFVHPAKVWVRLETRDAHSTVFLDIEHVRQLAEELPKLLMVHDASEHVAKEQAAALAEAA